MLARIQHRIERTGAALRKGRPDPLTSVVLTTPVFLVYHLGILLIDKRNGVDWVSDLTLELLHASVPAYVAVSVGLCAVLALAVFLLRKRGTVRPQALLPIVAESVVWAVLMLVSVGWAVQSVVPALSDIAPALRGGALSEIAPALRGGASLSVGALTQLGPIEKIVMAAGAGFHEEVTFRVILFSGGARLLASLGTRALPAFVVTALLSSLVFAFVHHLGPGGEGLTLAAFSFRTLAGLYLCALYAARGFAVAVYTHALYDALVFFVLQ
jgi:Type II CAAX prenyl endopeptidase Rce1-like